MTRAAVRWILALGMALPTLCPPTLRAAVQQEARARMEGQVVRSGEGFPGAMVTLHRVGQGDSGEVDSVSAGGEGRFAFDLPTVPDPGGRGEIYFASVRYRDILYFGAAIHQAVQLDTLYAIHVYDTVSAPPGGAPLQVVIRYLVAEAVADGWQVTDLWRVRNEDDRTLVPRGEGAVWQYPLPVDARSFELGTGDLPPEQARLVDGAFRVTAPIPPGDRQFMVRYVLDDLHFTLPLPGLTGQMELLIREPAPDLEVAGLAAVGSVEIDPGTPYRRYTGSGLRDATLVLAAGAGYTPPPTGVLAVVMALVLAGVGTWAAMRRRAPGGGPRGGTGLDSGRDSAPPTAPGDPLPMDRRRRLILDVARLDGEMAAAT
ncbi:MAG TPA: hypothetical protein VGA70_04350, partial [Longimicrobiales bacterium]